MPGQIIDEHVLENTPQPPRKRRIAHPPVSAAIWRAGRMIALLLTLTAVTGPGCARDADVAPAPDNGLVTGTTQRLYFGWPGGLAGEPGEPIPPQPRAGVEVYFRGEAGTFKTLSDAEGTYSIELPPGRYDIGWLEPRFSEPHDDPFAERRHLSSEATQVHVEPGEKHEVDLPVRVIQVD